MQKYNQEMFIEKANVKHSYRYDYSKVRYVNSKTKVCIICHLHGEFWQEPSNHLFGENCPLCSKIRTEEERQRRFNEFLKNAKLIHKDENLDYSKSIYVNNRTKIKIIDHDLDKEGNEYGEYWQTPSNHLKGQGHPKKKNEKISQKNSLTTKDIIQRFKEKHKGEDLDYSEVLYVDMDKPVKIICNELKDDGTIYGEFWQTPRIHLKGCSHPELGKKKQIEKQSSTTNEFIKKCKILHKDKNYDYSKVNYVNNHTKVEIICKKCNSHGRKHGSFDITPSNFLAGKGCPKCSESSLEKEVANFLEGNNIKFERQKTFPWLGKQRLDFYLPDYGVAIECQGEQHFKPVDFAGRGIEWSERHFTDIQERDKIKKELCAQNSIQILYFTNLKSYDTFLTEKTYHNFNEILENIYKRKTIKDYES